jgi:hypothetical protein
VTSTQLAHEHDAPVVAIHAPRREESEVPAGEGEDAVEAKPADDSAAKDAEGSD